MPGPWSTAVGVVMSYRAGVLKIDLSPCAEKSFELDANPSPSSQADHAHVSALAQRLIDGLTARVEHIVRNGDINGYPGCVNLSFAYVEVSVSFDPAAGGTDYSAFVGRELVDGP
jgi:cysteine sulfinate desulfinase/cysteine desulfurase-like protein